MRALFSGVTGIRSHQVRMDVIGNNIANVNTVGFKGSRVTFQDVFSQTMAAGSDSVNPQQVGLGVGVASTDLNQEAGSFQLTGRDLDLAIDGQGMFIMKTSAGATNYTRVGNFDWDSSGYLVNPATGFRVQGWTADKSGNIANMGVSSLGDIQLIKGDVALAQPTTSAEFGGNLDAGMAVPTAPATTPNYQTTFTAYDSLGNPQSIIVTFTNQTTAGGPPTWSWSAADSAGKALGSPGTLTFNTDGTLKSGGTGTSNQVTMSSLADGAADLKVDLDFSKLTQTFAGSQGSSVLARKVDGYPMGVLETVSVEPTGQISGVFSNGFRRVLAQIGMANFANTDGLTKVGNTNFAESASSGAAQVGTPSTGGRGRLVPGNLEMSNVDLSTEFTNMIMTQRGFQANTKIITTADEMLQDVVNLRR